ncbi:condensation domain-containing protein, partial [Peribacillus simplex]|uniref:condensation domain-containing protein n=1 Tax=Peribacillus simplex TaxID=1478 RepID=UPI003D2B3DA4
QQPTIKGLADYIKKADEKNFVKIPPVPQRDFYEVSSAQKRLYMVQQIEGAELAYNIPSSVRLSGPLDIAKLEKAIQSLVARHESFRTSFHLIDGELMQKIHEEVDVSLAVIPCENIELEERFHTFVRSFDLASAPLFRSELLKLSENEHVLQLDMHHIVSDGTSMSVLFNGLMRLYDGDSLEPLSIQYKDYAIWQNKRLNSEELTKQKAYWMNQLSGDLPVLEMKTDYNRPAVQRFEGDHYGFELGKILTAKLNRLMKMENTTLYTTLLTAYNVLLHKYTGQEDIIVGSPVAGRLHADVDSIVGMFVNTLAIRTSLKRDASFREYLQHVKETVLQAHEHQEYPFESLVDNLTLSRDLSRHPVFTTMFVLQDIDLAGCLGKGIYYEHLNHDSGISKFDLLFSAISIEKNVFIEIEYTRSLFKLSTIKRMSNHFINLLHQVIDYYSKTLSDFKLTSTNEEDIILQNFSTSLEPNLYSMSIVSQFEHLSLESGKDNAIHYLDKSLSFKTLNQRANQLAHFLQKNGVGRETLVGIIADRSIDTVVAMLGILKAGGAYVPIDPS